MITVLLFVLVVYAGICMMVVTGALLSELLWLIKGKRKSAEKE